MPADVLVTLRAKASGNMALTYIPIKLNALHLNHKMSTCSLNSLLPTDYHHQMPHGITSWLILVSAWRHQAITSTNIDLTSVLSWGIFMTTIPHEIYKLSISKMSLKITNFKSYPHVPRANVLSKRRVQCDIHLAYKLKLIKHTLLSKLEFWGKLRSIFQCYKKDLTRIYTIKTLLVCFKEI